MNIKNNLGLAVQRSAPPLATEVASLIKKVTLALRSYIRGFPVEKPQTAHPKPQTLNPEP